MHIILTGHRRVGKTTLCRRLTDELRRVGYRIGGVLTETQADEKGRTLVVHDLAAGSSAPLASTLWGGPGQTQGPFTFSDDALYKAIKAIGLGMSADLLVIDEIGPLEMKRQGFFPILHIVRRSRNSLLVVRPELAEQAKAWLRLGDDCETVVVTYENREQLFPDLLNRLNLALKVERLN
ncbi:MAG: AAA family ATPase [Myxococcales bacterium]|nr:AAA family ATPase [Myxococcales bacterium]